MAAASTKKLEELLQCSICMLKLTNAKSFKCLHYFCQPCIEKLQLRLENNVYGYECPMCRQMTPEKDIRNMHIIHGLIEVMDLAKKEQSLCKQCETEVAEHRCLDCKENMCAGCRAQHDKWSSMRNHEWQEISKEPKTVIDKHVFCPTHPKKLMELNCVDCNELICQLCNATKHKQHNAETIDDALQRLLPTVEKNKSRVLEDIQQNEDKLSSINDTINWIRRTYDAIDIKIDEQKQRAMKKLEEDAQLAKDQLAGFKKQELGETEVFMNEIDMQLKSQKNIVALTDTTLSTAQGSSLLQAIQTDIRERLDSHFEHPIKRATFDDKVNVRFEASPLPQSSLIGFIIKNNSKSKSQWPGSKSLAEVAQRTITPIKQSKLAYWGPKMNIVGNDIFMVEQVSSKIHKLSRDGTEIGTIHVNIIGECRSIVQAKDKIIIASTTGVHEINESGTVQSTITTGDFCDVSFADNKIFALEYGKGEVLVATFANNTQSFNFHSKFSIAAYCKDTCNTLTATQTSVFVAILTSNTIQQYSHHGILVSTHGPSIPKSLKKLSDPYVCCADDNGAVLIASERTNSMHVLYPDGKWDALQIQGLDHPIAALVIGNTLVVTQAYYPHWRLFSF